TSGPASLSLKGRFPGSSRLAPNIGLSDNDTPAPAPTKGVTPLGSRHTSPGTAPCVPALAGPDVLVVEQYIAPNSARADGCKVPALKYPIQWFKGKYVAPKPNST